MDSIVHGVTKSRTWLSAFHFHFSLAFTGEGNGNPLQCSCLENPRDGRAWWAAVYGVTKSRKQLSSSSSSAFICTKVLSTLPSAPGPSTDRATSSLSSRSLRVSYKTNKFLPCYCPPLKAWLGVLLPTKTSFTKDPILYLYCRCLKMQLKLA